MYRPQTPAAVMVSVGRPPPVNASPLRSTSPRPSFWYIHPAVGLPRASAGILTWVRV